MASHAGLSKADSKKALDGFIETTIQIGQSPTCCFDYNSETNTVKDLDKASPKLMEELAKKDARIAELEARIRELESGNMTVSPEESDTRGNDRVVRKKPGLAGNLDSDSDGDGLSDGIEEDESSETVRRPGFVNRMLSLFR